MPHKSRTCYLPGNILNLLVPKQFLFVSALLYTGLITYLSLINLADTPVSKLGVGDKVMHTGAYFGLALLWLLFVIFNAGNERFAKNLVLVCVACIIFGTFIEVLQHVLTEYRQLDLLDVLANSIGAIVAGTLVWLLKEILIRLKVKINLFFLKK